jgi:hypothetical protein
MITWDRGLTADETWAAHEYLMYHVLRQRSITTAFNVETGGTFSNPAGLSIDGDYILQNGYSNGKSYWARATGGMFLRWVVLDNDDYWFFDNDFDDNEAGAYLMNPDVASMEPEARAYLNEWDYGIAAGNNQEDISYLALTKGAVPVPPPRPTKATSQKRPSQNRPPPPPPPPGAERRTLGNLEC